MSTNSADMERPRNPTHFGGEGLYETSSVPDAGPQEPEPLKVTLGEQLDPSARQALQSAPDLRSTSRRTDSMQSFVRRYPLATALAAGAVGFLLVSLTRRSMQR